jgi:hypothetical protein
MNSTLQPVPYIIRFMSDVIEVNKTASIALALSTFAASVLPLAAQTRALDGHSAVTTVTGAKLRLAGKFVASIDLIEAVPFHVHAEALNDASPSTKKNNGYFKNLLNIFNPLKYFRRFSLGLEKSWFLSKKRTHCTYPYSLLEINLN